MSNIEQNIITQTDVLLT